MKKIKILVASLALIFAVASSFTTTDVTDITYGVLSVDKDVQLPNPAPADVPQWYDSNEFSTLQQGQPTPPSSSSLDVLKTQRCTNSSKLCFAVIKYQDATPIEVFAFRTGDFIGS